MGKFYKDLFSLYGRGKMKVFLTKCLQLLFKDTCIYCEVSAGYGNRDINSLITALMIKALNSGGFAAGNKNW